MDNGNSNYKRRKRMNRRAFNKALGAALAASILPHKLYAATNTHTASTDNIHTAIPGGPPSQIAMLIHPSFIPLDLFGPHAVFALLGNVQVHFVWKTREPVMAATGVPIQPTTTFAECPKQLMMLFVPGGLEGGTALMNDPEVMDFLYDRGSRAQYVTSVCTGSLLLGAAGLLRGYKATSHWTVRELLPLFGAEPLAQRIVEDRNRISGGGVTAGIDFGLYVAAKLRDEQYAKMLQLMLEYDPQPPFLAGSPEGAGTELTDHVRMRRSPAVEAARQAALIAQKRLNI
jgi:cyclohexyl-isocyanide hydratase